MAEHDITPESPKLATWDPNSCTWLLSPPHPNEHSKTIATSERKWVAAWGYTIVGGPLLQPEPWHAKLLRLAQELDAATTAHEAAKEAHRLAAEDLAAKAIVRDVASRRFDRSAMCSEVIAAASWEVSHG